VSIAGWADVATIGAAIAAIVGLALIWSQLWLQTRIRRDELDYQRMQLLPYVRVDVLPGDPMLARGLKAEAAYFHDRTRLLDLSAGALSTRTIVALFRNYQPHPLGFASLVSAGFLIEASPPDLQVSNLEFTVVDIPYLEAGKPVAVDLCRFDARMSVTVTCTDVRYVDLLGRLTEREADESTTYVWHGRHVCSWNGRAFDVEPKAWR